MTVTTDSAIRCSTWTREQSVDPVGTAGSYRGHLLIELPLPWPRDIGQVAELQPLAALLGERGYRMQALVPPSRGTARRMILHSPAPAPAGGDGDGWFAGYVRVEAPAGDDPAATLAGLLDAAPSPASGGGDQPVDLLVCTHGRRDVCCGSLGTELALELARPARIPPGVNLWRTSHTGGHRFAPTFVVLPQGTVWAYAGLDLVDAVLERSVPFSEVAGRYRGCAGLGPAPVQALEREVLSRVGWELMDRPRRGFATGEAASQGGSLFRLEADGGAWEAVVRPGRTLPVPDCMRPVAEARKTETEWEVSDLRSV